MNHVFRSITLGLVFLIACQSEKRDFQPINPYEFINTVVRDSTISKHFNPSVDVIVADLGYISTPFMKGKEINFVAGKFGESDTLYLHEQYSAPFLRDSLTSFGLRVVHLKDPMATGHSGDSIFSYLESQYGASGYFAIAKPVFSTSQQFAYLKLAYRCGKWCGFSSSYILTRKQNRWTIKEILEISEP